MSGSAQGFRWANRRGGEIEITHNGHPATLLRGDKAAGFRAEIDAADAAAAQDIMARLTGNYRRGNERQARMHPRNAG